MEWLAVRAHRLALAGLRSIARHVISTARTIRLISNSFVHNSGAEAHLSSAVKRLAIRAHRLTVAGLRRSRTERDAGNQRR